MIDNLKAEIQSMNLPKPQVEIWRLTDQKENIDAFKNKSPIVKGTATRNNTLFTMNNYKNVAAYEVYTKGELVFVSPHNSFTVPDNIVDKSTYVVAVSAIGEKVKVTF